LSKKVRDTFEIVELALRLVPVILLLNVNIVTSRVSVAPLGKFGVVIVVLAGIVNLNILVARVVIGTPLPPAGKVPPGGTTSKLYPLIINARVVSAPDRDKLGAYVTVLIVSVLFVFPNTDCVMTYVVISSFPSILWR
jgi:hypothetical protein